MLITKQLLLLIPCIDNEVSNDDLLSFRNAHQKCSTLLCKS